MNEKLIGKIITTPNLQGSIKQNSHLQGKLNYSSYEIYNAEKYEGEYNITPLAFQQQELETKNRILEENVIVREVPFFEVSNTEGTTVYIGSEV